MHAKSCNIGDTDRASTRICKLVDLGKKLMVRTELVIELRAGTCLLYLYIEGPH